MRDWHKFEDPDDAPNLYCCICLKAIITDGSWNTEYAFCSDECKEEFDNAT